MSKENKTYTIVYKGIDSFDPTVYLKTVDVQDEKELLKKVREIRKQWNNIYCVFEGEEININKLADKIELKEKMFNSMIIT